MCQSQNAGSGVGPQHQILSESAARDAACRRLLHICRRGQQQGLHKCMRLTKAACCAALQPAMNAASWNTTICTSTGMPCSRRLRRHQMFMHTRCATPAPHGLSRKGAVESCNMTCTV